MKIFLDLCVNKWFKDITMFKFLLIRNDPRKWLGLFNFKCYGWGCLTSTFFYHPLWINFFVGYPATESQFSYHHPSAKFILHFCTKVEKYHTAAESFSHYTPTELQKYSDHPHVEFYKGIWQFCPYLFKWNSPYNFWFQAMGWIKCILCICILKPALAFST